MTRPLHKIALEIDNDWPHWKQQAARPYVQAMGCLNALTDTYGHDSARDIVLRFLVNAASWRGETARRVKKELNLMLAEKE